MVEFQDPITDTEYDPIDNPTGTLLRSVSFIGGIAMTGLLFGLAVNFVLPRVSDVFASLTGVQTGNESGGIPGVEDL